MDIREVVLDMCGKMRQPMTPEDMAEALGHDYDSVHLHLCFLAEEGVIRADVNKEDTSIDTGRPIVSHVYKVYGLA